MDVEGRGRSSLHDGLLDVAWFCVCKLGGSWAKLGGGASALGDRKFCVEVV